MVLKNLKFWSISFEESLGLQQKHALKNRFLRALSCSNDNFNPGWNRKMLIRKIKSIPDGGCFSYEQLFRPAQRIA